MHSFFTSMAIVLPNSQQHINVNLVQDYQNTLEIDDVITLKERVACAELITKYSYPQLSSVKESLIKDMSSIPSTFIKSDSNQYVTMPITESDSSSLYRCVSMIIFGQEKYWSIIRHAVINHMHIHVDIFNRVCKEYGKKSVIKYSVYYHNANDMVPDIDLRAISHFFKLSIYVFTEDSIMQGCLPIKITPQSVDKRAKPIRHALHLHKNSRPEFFQPVIRFNRQYSYKKNECALKLVIPRKRIENVPASGKQQEISSISDFISEEERQTLVNAIWCGDQYFGCLNDKLPSVESSSTVFESKQMVNDGNTFYRSLSFLLTSQETYHDKIRAKVFEFMNDIVHRYDLNKICFSKEGVYIDSYLKNWSVQTSGVSAKPMEIYAAALLLKCNIYIFNGNIEDLPEVYTCDDACEGGLVLHRIDCFSNVFNAVVKYNKHLQHNSINVVVETQNVPMDTDTPMNTPSYDFKDICDLDFSALEDTALFNSLSDIKTNDVFDAIVSDPQDMLLDSIVDYNNRSPAFKFSLDPEMTLTVQQKREKIPQVSATQCDGDYYYNNRSPAFKFPLDPEMTLTVQQPKSFPVSTTQSSTEYYYEQNMGDNRDSYTIIVPCALKSKSDGIEYAMKTVLKKPMEPTSLVENLEDMVIEKGDIFSERNWNLLAAMVNETFQFTIMPPRILEHFKRVCREANLTDLLKTSILNERANEHRVQIIDMRTRLQPIMSDSPQESIREKVRFTCIAIPTSSMDNDLCYYYTGGKTGRWLPLPINPKMFGIHSYLVPPKSLTVDNEMFVLTDNELTIIDLFQEDKQTICMPIPISEQNDLKLAKSNLGTVFILDIVRSNYIRVTKTKALQWESFAEIEHVKLSNSIQYTVRTVENQSSEILIVPSVQTENQHTLTDLHVYDTYFIPQCNEYILKFNQNTKQTSIQQLHPGFIQIKLCSYDNFSDTKYILVNTDILNQTIHYYKNK
jgi:hypothetical protein